MTKKSRNIHDIFYDIQYNLNAENNCKKNIETGHKWGGEKGGSWQNPKVFCHFDKVPQSTQSHGGMSGLSWKKMKQKLHFDIRKLPNTMCIYHHLYWLLNSITLFSLSLLVIALNFVPDA